MRLLRGKAEHLVLAGPLRRQVGKASNAHTMGKPAVDGRFDQIGCEESQRNRQVDLSRAAVFPLGDAAALAVGSAMSSSSQRRPRAIAATNLARVSERIGRACSGRIPSGRRIPRRRVAGVFRHGT